MSGHIVPHLEMIIAISCNMHSVPGVPKHECMQDHVGMVEKGNNCT